MLLFSENTAISAVAFARPVRNEICDPSQSRSLNDCIRTCSLSDLSRVR